MSRESFLDFDDEPVDSLIPTDVPSTYDAGKHSKLPCGCIIDITAHLKVYCCRFHTTTLFEGVNAR